MTSGSRRSQGEALGRYGQKSHGDRCSDLDVDLNEGCAEEAEVLVRRSRGKRTGRVGVFWPTGKRVNRGGWLLNSSKALLSLS